MKDLLRFRLQDLSLYRSELMGWAILWVMMLHFTFTQIKPLGFLAQYGISGVDIFMFVSGLGLYYSLDKNGNLQHFYKKRLLRIFPIYYVIGVFASLLVYHDSLPEFLFRYSTLGFWIGGIFYEWYIPSIVCLYLLAPFLKWLVDYRHALYAILLSVLLIILSYFLVEKTDIIDYEHYFLLYRSPAFIFGMLCAYWIKHQVSARYFFIIAVIGIPLFVLLFPQHHAMYRYKYFSLFFLMPCFIYAFCTLSKLLPPLRRLMAKMGNASLEIYLIQCIFFVAIINHQLAVPDAWHDAITLSLIALCTILGLSAHWLFKRLGL